jgi:heme/copper-type cytochrome/quinol oxidase subunit 2
MKTRSLFALTLVLLALPHFLLAYAVSVPPLNAIGGAFLVLALLAWRFDNWWAIVPGILLSAIAAYTFLFYTAFTRFDSAPEFTSAVSSLSLGTVAAILGITDLIARKRSAPRLVAPAVVRSFALGVTTLVVVGAASAIVTVVSHDTVSASDREGALVIGYKNTDVIKGDTPFTAKAGEVRIVVDNKDVSFHNFVIKEEGISIDLGPRESKLLIKDMAPGTYSFKCTIAGHSAMKGTLVVE